MQVEKTIFIIDDDAAIRDSFTELGRMMGHNVQGFESANKYLEAYDPSRPGCIVLDVRMPGINGLNLQQELLRRGNRLPIIIVTGHGDVPMGVSAIKAGAVDFLEKPVSPEKLVQTIRDALELDTQRREELSQLDTVETQLEQLTEDERRVLKGVADGKTHSAIAGELDISLRTVQFRLASVKKKLRVDSKSEMIRLARRTEVADRDAPDASSKSIQ